MELFCSLHRLTHRGILSGKTDADALIFQVGRIYSGYVVFEFYKCVLMADVKLLSEG